MDNNNEGKAIDKSTLGLFAKYRVTRIDDADGPGGKHEHCQLFVLDLPHDQFALPAIEVYAKCCFVEFPRLAKDLQDLAGIHGHRFNLPGDLIDLEDFDDLEVSSKEEGSNIELDKNGQQYNDSSIYGEEPSAAIGETLELGGIDIGLTMPEAHLLAAILEKLIDKRVIPEADVIPMDEEQITADRDPAGEWIHDLIDDIAPAIIRIREHDTNQ